MAVRSTSKESYRTMQEGQALGQQTKSIVKFIRKHKRPVTRREIERGTGISISSVTARVNELVRSGVIEEQEQIFCPITGRKVHPLIAA